MRHAGMLRIDHAMGLTRLFVVPDGAKPAEGAYLAYPLDDLVGHVALESQRRACMVVGEDLGTVPEGFRDALARADILGMRVLWFERRGADFLQPADYPALSIACVGDPRSADAGGLVARRRHRRAPAASGSLGLEDAQAQIAERAEGKARAGRRPRRPRPDRRRHGSRGADVATNSPPRSTPSSPPRARCCASAQLDDLAGESDATNLPGTDRERPNWRHRARPRRRDAVRRPAREGDSRGAGGAAGVKRGRPRV